MWTFDIYTRVDDVTIRNPTSGRSERVRSLIQKWVRKYMHFPCGIVFTIYTYWDLNSFIVFDENKDRTLLQYFNSKTCVRAGRRLNIFIKLKFLPGIWHSTLKQAKKVKILFPNCNLSRTPQFSSTLFFGGLGDRTPGLNDRRGSKGINGNRKSSSTYYCSIEQTHRGFTSTCSGNFVGCSSLCLRWCTA